MPIHNVVILAAGQGTRLKPLTDTTPKALIPIGDETILGRLLRQLDAVGVAQIHVVTGYRAGDIAGFVGTHSARGKTSLAQNPDFAQTNTAYSLALALRNISGPFALFDGDLVLSDALIKLLCDGDASAAILCDMDVSRLDEEAMKIRCGGGRQVMTIGKSIPIDTAHGESIGAGRFDWAWTDALKGALTRIRPEDPCAGDYYDDVMATLIARSNLGPLGCLPVGHEKWVEVDDATDLRRAVEAFGEGFTFSL